MTAPPEELAQPANEYPVRVNVLRNNAALTVLVSTFIEPAPPFPKNVTECEIAALVMFQLIRKSPYVTDRWKGSIGIPTRWRLSPQYK